MWKSKRPTSTQPPSRPPLNKSASLAQSKKAFLQGNAFFVLACLPQGWRAEAQLQRSEAWCAREDSNLHTSRHKNLNLACLPIPPRAHFRKNGARIKQELLTKSTVSKTIFFAPCHQQAYSIYFGLCCSWFSQGKEVGGLCRISMKNSGKH